MKKFIVFSILCAIVPFAVYGTNVGDKITLSKVASKYATGETIPERFFGKTFTVQQVGSRQHPNAVLLQEIYSWVEVKDVTDATLVEQKENLLHVAQSDIDKLGRRYVILYDTVVKVITDTVVVRDTVYKDKKVELTTDTILKVNRKVIIQYDTMFVDGGSKWQSKDTVYIVKADSAYMPDNEHGEDKFKTSGFDRFSIGVRSGAAIAIMSSGSFTSRVGYNAMLDLEYSHFFNRKSDSKPYCGILAGVSVGYISTGMKGSVKDQYTTADADGDRVDYTITADNVVSSIGQLQVQVPLMFTMLYKGLFLNVGPRFAIPVYSPYSQTLENAHIAAYYEPYGVTRVDNVITGKLAEEQLNTKSTWNAPVFQLFVSAEIGYEFALKNGHSIGIGLYADYCAFNTFKKDATASSMISVSQIGADPANPAPKVDVLPAISVYADRFSCFDVGLKLVYNLNFKK